MVVLCHLTTCRSQFCQVPTLCSVGVTSFECQVSLCGDVYFVQFRKPTHRRNGAEVASLGPSLENWNVPNTFKIKKTKHFVLGSVFLAVYVTAIDMSQHVQLRCSTMLTFADDIQSEKVPAAAIKSKH